MGNFQIGIMADSFRLDLHEGIKRSRQLGAQGIQIYAVQGEMCPGNMTLLQRKELLDFIKSNSLVVSALCGDLGGHGFEREKDNVWKIEKSKRIMDLAIDLECYIVTTHIGVIPSDNNHPRRGILQEACEELGEYGDKVGAFFAIETGPETAATLKDFLDSIHSKGVKVNLDPANLVMVTGDDPVEAVDILKNYIVHTHAKDGVMLKKSDPEKIYNFFAEGGIEDIHLDEFFKETPLGEGDVDFAKYLGALDSIGYNGFLTIEREVGIDPEADIKAAVKFLEKKMNLV